MTIATNDNFSTHYSDNDNHPTPPKKPAFKRRTDPLPSAGATALLFTSDSLEKLRAMEDGSVSIFFFSPPYNKRARRQRSKTEGGTWKGATLLTEGYASYSDDMPHEDYVAWMKAILLECWRVLKDDGAIFFQHKDQQYKGETITPDELNPGLPLRQRIIWDRGSGPTANRNFLRPSYEFIYLFAKPKFKFGTCGKIMDVIRVRPANSDHPAPFPVELPQTIFKQLSPHHDVICDPFSGSGSTGVAALAEGRNYIGIELDAGYNTKAAARLHCADPNIVVPSVTATAPTVELHLGDCLNSLKALPDSSVDLIAFDPPYETTNLEWDKLILFELLWPELRRVLTPTGTVIMTAAQPFTSMAVMSAPDLFKFSLVWKKSRPTGHLLAKCRPMMEHEDVLVFSKGATVHAGRTARPMTYNPQGLVTLDKPLRSRNGRQSGMYNNSGQPGPANGYQTFNGGRIYHKEDVRVQTEGGYPTSILEFDSERGTGHPTQKPVALFEYLIRTFSNPGDVVCDLTMGSGTTGVAAVNTGRSFIGVELDPDFFAIAAARVLGEPFAHLVEIMHANAAARAKAERETKALARAAKKAAREALKAEREVRKAAKTSAKVVTISRACRSMPDYGYIVIEKFAA